MPVHDNLGIRMKTYYEQIPKMKLMRRTPVAIRIDGKSFHTFTKGFEKPFDHVLMKSMQETMKYLCENIQGCVLGYAQSDEITLILIDYQTFDADAWFDYEVQKICSIAASMATMAFNRFFSNNIQDFLFNLCDPLGEKILSENKEKYNKYSKVYIRALEKGAMFDARCFNIPKEEVTNLLFWRQVDATRNSIQMVGQANFSHKELQNKSCNMIQDMLHEQKGINWNDYPTECKRGTCCIKQEAENITFTSFDGKTEPVQIKFRWVIDKEIPIFKNEGREYIERFINIEQ